MASDLTKRVEALEAAVLALGTEEFGDTPGHDFHGNQWTSGGTGADRSATQQSREDREKNRDPNAYKGAKPPPPPPAPAPPPKPLTEAQVERGVKKAQREMEIGIKDAIRDNPDFTSDEIARDIAEGVALMHPPEVVKEFYRREGFELRPNELRRRG